MCVLWCSVWAYQTNTVDIVKVRTFFVAATVSNMVNEKLDAAPSQRRERFVF